MDIFFENSLLQLHFTMRSILNLINWVKANSVFDNVITYGMSLIMGFNATFNHLLENFHHYLLFYSRIEI